MIDNIVEKNAIDRKDYEIESIPDIEFYTGKSDAYHSVGLCYLML